MVFEGLVGDKGGRGVGIGGKSSREELEKGTWVTVWEARLGGRD